MIPAHVRARLPQPKRRLDDGARALVAADLPGTMPSHRLGQSLADAVFRAIDGVNEPPAGPR